MRLLAFALLAIAVTAETDLERYPFTPYLCVFPNPESTVKSYPEDKFNSIDDAKSLNASDPSNVIELLTNRSANQRQEIGTSYKNIHNKELLEALNDYGDNDYRYAIECMMLPVAEVYARTIANLTDQPSIWNILTYEIASMASTAEIENVSAIFEKLTGDTLLNKIHVSIPILSNQTLTFLLAGYRTENCSVPADYTDVSKDTEKLNDFLLTATYRQLLKMHTHQIRYIKNPVLSADPELRLAVRRKVRYVYKPFSAIVNGLLRSMNNYHIDDRPKTMARLIVTRSGIDLGSIKSAYTSFDNKSLYNDIKKKYEGHFRDLLLALVKP